MRYSLYTTKACLSCRYLQKECTTPGKGRRTYRWEHQNIFDDMGNRLREYPYLMTVWKAMC